jgi:hypothetical protein
MPILSPQAVAELRELAARVRQLWEERGLWQRKRPDELTDDASSEYWAIVQTTPGASDTTISVKLWNPASGAVYGDAFAAEVLFTGGATKLGDCVQVEVQNAYVRVSLRDADADEWCVCHRVYQKKSVCS